MSPDGVQGQSPCVGREQKLIYTPSGGERGGAAAAPAGRRLPQEARAARSRGKAKFCSRRHAVSPSLSQTDCHHNSTRGFGGRVPRQGAGAEPLRRGRVPRRGAGAEPLRRGRVPRRGAGAEPLHQFTAKLLLTAERGERGGAAAAPAVLFRSIFVFYILRRLYLYGNICINKIISLCLNIMNFALFNTAKNSWRCIIRPPRQNYDSLAERCCRSIL